MAKDELYDALENDLIFINGDSGLCGEDAAFDRGFDEAKYWTENER